MARVVSFAFDPVDERMDVVVEKSGSVSIKVSLRCGDFTPSDWSSIKLIAQKVFIVAANKVQAEL